MAPTIAHIRDVENALTFLHVRNPRDGLERSLSSAKDFIFLNTASQNSYESCTHPETSLSSLTTSDDMCATRGRSASDATWSSLSGKPASPVAHLHVHRTPGHCFVLTARDGSRLHCFARRLSHIDVLLIIDIHPLAALYLNALERAAVAYISVIQSCITREGYDDMDKPDIYISRTDNKPPLSSWLTFYVEQICLTEHLSTFPISSTSSNTSSSSLEEPSQPDTPNPLLHNLADINIPLRQFRGRPLLTILTALLEERRVIIVGNCNAVTSRCILALNALLAPFSWPHLLLPIVPEHYLPVLAAPFPYLAGLPTALLPAMRALPVEGVLVAHCGSGVCEFVGDCTDDVDNLLRHVSRRTRCRFLRGFAKMRAQGMGEREVSGAMLRTVRALYPRVLRKDRIGNVERTMMKFFGDLLEGEILRQGDTTPKRQRFIPWNTPNFAQDCVLAAQFRNTQMYMQWQSESGEMDSFLCKAKRIGDDHAATLRRGNSGKGMSDRDYCRSRLGRHHRTFSKQGLETEHTPFVRSRSRRNRYTIRSRSFFYS